MMHKRVTQVSPKPSRTIKNHQLTVSGSNTDLSLRDSEPVDKSEPDSTPPPPDQNSDDDIGADEPEALAIVRAHHAIEAEIFGIAPDKQAVRQSDLAIARAWLDKGITAAFCRKVFRSRLKHRQEQGKGAVVNFRYWRDVVTDEWARTPTATASFDGEPVERKPFEPMTAEITCSVPELRSYLEMQGIPLSEAVPWAQRQMQALAGDAKWHNVLSRLRQRHGEAKVERWWGMLRPIVSEPDQLIL